VIGGKSGNRETAVFVFVVVTALVVWVIHREASGIAMPGAYGLLALGWPASIAGVVGAHALKHLKPDGMADVTQRPRDPVQMPELD
jgi:hypothetical protein